jgi:hypothetical protein
MIGATRSRRPPDAARCCPNPNECPRTRFASGDEPEWFDANALLWRAPEPGPRAMVNWIGRGDRVGRMTAIGRSGVVLAMVTALFVRSSRRGGERPTFIQIDLLKQGVTRYELTSS